MSVTAGAFVASSLAQVSEVEASSYVVQQGDSLWSISQKFNTTVDHLKSLNKLSSNLIQPNQTLKIDGTVTSAPSTSNDSTYTVVSGDSLSKIAARHNISLSNLMEWNNLSTTLIYPGDQLKVKKTANQTQNNTNSSSTNSTTKPANTSTYIVKSGDTLSHIAAAHNISVTNLKKWNELSSDLIRPGDRLVVAESSTTAGNSSSTTNSSSEVTNNNHQSNNSSSTYTVKSGDTLSKIASIHGISLQNLKKWNNITSHLIYPGQKLNVKNNDTSNNQSKPSDNKGSSNGNVQSLVDSAKSALGSKYVWGGSNMNTGFDCSGFIYWAFNQAGKGIQRLSTDGYYNRSYIVNKPEVGDLVFFENTYRQGISHMGIYIGNNEFIHAGSSTGVTVTNLNNSYWQKHFHSFKRFY